MFLKIIALWNGKALETPLWQNPILKSWENSTAMSVKKKSTKFEIYKFAEKSTIFRKYPKLKWFRTFSRGYRTSEKPMIHVVQN